MMRSPARMPYLRLWLTLAVSALVVASLAGSAVASPTCNNLHVRLIIYTGSKALSAFTNPSPDGCYESRRVIDEKSTDFVTSINPQGWWYTICHHNVPGSVYKHAGAPYRVYDDTHSDYNSYNFDQNQLLLCANSAPVSADINLEYMTPYPLTSNNPCTVGVQCWQEVLVGTNSNGQYVNVDHYYTELYYSDSDVEPLLSDWKLDTYHIYPANSAGTLDATPFLDENSSFYAQWTALSADVYDLCRATQTGYLSIYANGVTNYQNGQNVLYDTTTQFSSSAPYQSGNPNEGTSSVEQTIIAGLNNCVS
jgi:hypothetical protein